MGGYMRRNVLIMRGLPGSGKSSKVNKLIEDANYLNISIAVCSADDYRYENGEYVFRESREPHDKCFDKFKQETDKGTEIVVVDNTNCTLRSMKPYVIYAIEKGYKVYLHSIQPVDIKILFERNIHKVPMESLERMLRRWVPNPTIEEILAAGKE